LIGADYSSKFSPWLANGSLSPREIYYELKKYEEEFGSNESTYWLVFELLWRDYFRFMMKKHRHQFFLQTGIKPTDSPKKYNNQELLNQWINGNTGVDFIDANMIELKLTGFMSNRGRQNVASYLCNDLKLDWRYGAAYFEQQLIDYDVCSNWGNWAYLAGVGKDPRGNRYFNITKQADNYDSKKQYRILWTQII
jgi:deoxyribodipyrimidine photo-lyase